METDWNTAIAKAMKQFDNDLPFVLYAKPDDKSLTGIFQHDAVSYTTSNFNETGFVFAPFNGDRKFLIPADKSDVFEFPMPNAVPKTDTVLSDANDEAKTAFENLVGKGISAIGSGKLGKVVLSRKEIVPAGNFMEIFHRLVTAYPTAFRYCWFHPQTGLWMGATPERLLKVENREFQTVALAGTQMFYGSENVIWQEKEKREQQFVTDFIAEGLRGKASMELSEPYTVRAGNLLHIKTDISGTLNADSRLDEILQILHPTPAVCGYPKNEAKKFILENEGYDREFYSGFLGEINVGDNSGSDLYVNLRCMKIAQKEAHLYIGCGITEASDPEKEFYETANKALTMKKIVS